MENGKRRLPDGGVLRAAAIDLGAYLLLLALAAYLTLSGRVGEEHMQSTARLCAAVAAFVGAALTVHRGVPAALATTGIFCAVTLLLGVLLCGALHTENTLEFLLAALLGTLPALLLWRRGRARRRRRVPTRRST